LHPATKNVIDLLLKKPKFTFAAVAVLIVIVISAIKISGTQEGDGKVWAEVMRDDFVDELVESGEIQAVNAQYVNVPRIWNMEFQIVDMAPEGNLVKKGDFLIQFDTSTLQEQLDAAIDQMNQAEADLKSIEVQQASRMSELETNLLIADYSKEASELKVELLKFESKNRREEARLDHEKELIRFDETSTKIENQKIIHRAEYMKNELKYKQEKDKVKKIRQQITDLTLRAPMDGMVVYQEIGGRGPDNPSHKPMVGDKVNPDTAVMGIPDLSKMKMILPINEMDVARLANGMKVSITLDAYENNTFHGQITNIASLVEKDSAFWRGPPKPPSFTVTVLIEESDPMLKPGMTAQGVIELKCIQDALIVPIGSVFELKDGSTVVFTEKRYPDPVQVTIEKRNDRYAIVTEGLNEGTSIAWHAPKGTAQPLGWYAEMEKRRTEHQELVGHIDSMNERGMIYDPAKADSLAALEKNKNMPASMNSSGAKVKVMSSQSK